MTERTGISRGFLLEVLFLQHGVIKVMGSNDLFRVAGVVDNPLLVDCDQIFVLKVWLDAAHCTEMVEELCERCTNVQALDHTHHGKVHFNICRR